MLVDLDDGLNRGNFLAKSGVDSRVLEKSEKDGVLMPRIMVLVLAVISRAETVKGIAEVILYTCDSPGGIMRL